MHPLTLISLFTKNRELFLPIIVYKFNFPKNIKNKKKIRKKKIKKK